MTLARFGQTNGRSDSTALGMAAEGSGESEFGEFDTGGEPGSKWQRTDSKCPDSGPDLVLCDGSAPVTEVSRLRKRSRERKGTGLMRLVVVG